MQTKDLATSYLTSLEEEIKQNYPESDVLFMFLSEMKEKLDCSTLEERDAFLELVDQFEEILDVEVFWNT